MRLRSAIVSIGMVLAACGGGSGVPPTTTAPPTTVTTTTAVATTVTTASPTSTTTTLIEGPVDVLVLPPYPLLMSSFGPTGVRPAPDTGLTMALVVAPQASASSPGVTASGTGVSTVIGLFGAASGFPADCLGFTLWAEDFSSRYVDGFVPLTEGGCGDPGGPVIPDAQVLLLTEHTLVIRLGVLPGGSFAPAFQVQNTAGDTGYYSIGQDLIVEPSNVPDLVDGPMIVFGGDLLDVRGTTFRVIDAPPWAAGGCDPDDASLCFGPFLVSAEETADGVSVGPGTAVPFGTAYEGGFRFGSEDDLDVTVKLVNGCAVNRRIWVLVAPLTPIATVVTVTDITRGPQMTYPSTASFEPVVDTEAFATCM